MVIPPMLSSCLIIIIICLAIYIKIRKRKKVVGYISQLYTYPVKSGKAISLDSAEITQLGVKHDRQYVLLNENGGVIAVRRNLKLAGVRQRITNEEIILEYDGMKPLHLPLSIKREEGDFEQNIKWLKLTTFGVHVSDEADTWFSTLLGTEGVELFCYPSDGVPRYSLDKGVKVENYKNDKESIMFANSCPLLLLTESSLESLKETIGEDVSVGHFRPSIVVSGCDAFAEEQWSVLEINNVRLQALYPAPRCPNITVNPVTCEIQEGIHTGLKKERAASDLGYTHPLLKGTALFGMYLGVRKEGTINVGDPVYHLLS